MSLTIITMIASVVVLTFTMILFWKRDLVTSLAYPREILLISDMEERRRVHGIGMIAFMKQRSTWIALIAYTLALLVPSVLVCAALLTVAETRGGQSSVTGLKLVAILCALIAPLVLGLLMWGRERKWMGVFLRDYLNEHGTPICRECGYDLRGQVQSRCPECGMQFDGKHD